MEKTKIVVPERLRQISKMTLLKDVLQAIGKTEGIELSNSCYVLSPLNQEDDKFLIMEKRPRGNLKNSELYLSVDCYTLSQQLLYITEDLSTWVFTLSFQTNENLDLYFLPSKKDQVIEIVSVEIKDIKPIKKLLYEFDTIQPREKVLSMIERNNRYAAAFVRENHLNPYVYCMAPQLEQLHKMGIRFTSLFFSWKQSDEAWVSHQQLDKSSIDAFNRLTKRGTNPQTIFKTNPSVYNNLKNETDLRIWDNIRKLEKFGSINDSTIRMIIAGRFSHMDLDNVKSILSFSYNGSPVFTIETLVNYLNRIDLNEAIGRKEGLQLLADYLRCCEVLEVKPKVDGDSLKREHDVMARNVRQHRDSIMAQIMQDKCHELQLFNYRECVFFARAIQSYDDLLDEASQQHNCVASYAQSIVSGRTQIFVVRYVSAPERSYITLELDPKTAHIRQMYLAYNQPVKNKAVKEFINRFQEHVKSIRKGNTAKAVTA